MSSTNESCLYLIGPICCKEKAALYEAPLLNRFEKQQVDFHSFLKDLVLEGLRRQGVALLVCGLALWIGPFGLEARWVS